MGRDSDVANGGGLRVMDYEEQLAKAILEMAHERVQAGEEEASVQRGHWDCVRESYNREQGSIRQVN